jgi:hypothetical protein
MKPESAAFRKTPLGAQSAQSAHFGGPFSAAYKAHTPPKGVRFVRLQDEQEKEAE